MSRPVVRGFKRLGGKLTLAVVFSLLLTVGALLLALSSEPRYAVIPVSLQLCMLFLLTVVMYARLKRGLWKVDRIRSNLATHRREFNASFSSEVDNSSEFERVALMQRRVIAAVETERLEAAERHAKLVEYIENGRR